MSFVTVYEIFSKVNDAVFLSIINKTLSEYEKREVSLDEFKKEFAFNSSWTNFFSNRGIDAPQEEILESIKNNFEILQSAS